MAYSWGSDPSHQQFDVPADAPRAVPGDARFPVTGRFEDDGRTYAVSLHVTEGALEYLEVHPLGDDEGTWVYLGNEADDAAIALPDAERVELWVETDQGAERFEA
ncbi:hypothetical protein GCM10025876_05600 [Demequina litorisediminis]|uniref:Uncharacterized protein n=1 Tax=Demequina litorisediminis TaxID=1849022 RepID=A0ABQ6IA72_9MICO|nr:hypothetical protein GCM10025876_05600 [Demequina litorisediminis]